MIDGGSSAGTAPTVSGWDLIVGDSLTEGIASNSGADSILTSWAYLFGQGINDIGRDFALSACGYNGWLKTGDSSGDVPAYYFVSGGVYADTSSRWNKVDSAISLLDTNGQISAYGAVNTPPANIYVNLSTNDQIYVTSSTDMTSAVQQFIAAARAAAPNAKIWIIVPFALYATAPFPLGPDLRHGAQGGCNELSSCSSCPTAMSRLVDFGVAFANVIQSTLYGGSGRSPEQPGALPLRGAKMSSKIAALNAVLPPRFAGGFH